MTQKIGFLSIMAEAKAKAEETFKKETLTLLEKSYKHKKAHGTRLPSREAEITKIRNKKKTFIFNYIKTANEQGRLNQGKILTDYLAN